MENADSIQDVINGHPMFLNIAVLYIRPKQSAYIRETLQGVIRGVIDEDDLDLETDPTKVCLRAACVVCAPLMLNTRFIAPW